MELPAIQEIEPASLQIWYKRFIIIRCRCKTDTERKVFGMAFLGELLEYVITYVILIAIAIGGLFFGKFLRTKKNQKTSEE